MSTSTFRALGFRFAVATTADDLRAHLDTALADLRDPCEPSRLYTVLDRMMLGRREYELHLDDQHLMSSESASEVVRDLVRSVNREVVVATPDLVFLHSSAVEHEGAAAIFPASMESGKTTLAAGLARAGLRYVSDELVALEPRSLRVHPYPKPLSLDPGSWPLFAESRPPGPDDLVDLQWQVPASSFRPDAVAPECSPGVVVFPRYEEGATTALERAGQAEALMALAGNALNLRQLGLEGATTLAVVAERCPAYRLTVGDLDAACGLVFDLLGRHAPAPAGGPR